MVLAATAFLASGLWLAPASANASHLPNKTLVLIGGFGRNIGETHWGALKEQLALRDFPDSNVLEFQYAGGTFSPDGSWNPYPGGACESYSKASFLMLRQMMLDLTQVRPDNEVFLVGYDVGGFVATMSLWAAAFQQDDPAIWQNLSGIASISGAMSGLTDRRVGIEGTVAARQGCADQSMLLWMKEVGDNPERYVVSQQRAALAMQEGYKIGSFGNTVDCFYRYVSPDICPKMQERAGAQAVLLPLLGDERQTMFIKNGTVYKEYNVAAPVPDELADNHAAVLVSSGPMADLAEYVLSQTR